MSCTMATRTRTARACVCTHTAAAAVAAAVIAAAVAAVAVAVTGVAATSATLSAAAAAASASTATGYSWCCYSYCEQCVEMLLLPGALLHCSSVADLLWHVIVVNTSISGPAEQHNCSSSSSGNKVCSSSSVASSVFTSVYTYEGASNTMGEKCVCQPLITSYINNRARFLAHTTTILAKVQCCMCTLALLLHVCML
jgi:hypothetical protein